LGSVINDYPIVNDWAAYESALKDNGLHPSDNVLLDHSRVRVQGIGSAVPNVAANGMYDFVLAYYNPNGSGSTVGTDNKSLLPVWPTSGLTFDGSANGAVTSRNIGGVTANSADRKAAVAGGGYQQSEPRTDYVGNLTVPMANYLISSLGISEFKNTNIIGDGDKWSSLSGSNYLSLIPTRNIGLIGDYNNIVYIDGNFNGVIDIKFTTISSTLFGISQTTANRGYLNIWHDISSETRYGAFGVVYIRGLGGEYIHTGVSGFPATYTNVIISKKYAGSLVGHASLQPNHRAFVDNTGQAKVTGADLTGIDTKYLGTDATRPVPSLNEEDWLKFGNGATSGFSTGVTLVNGIPQLATNYTNLRTKESGKFVWANLADFNANAVE